MKKLVNYILSFLMMISFVVPFIPERVYALSSSFTYAYIDATDLSVRSCASENTNICPRLRDGEGDTIWLNRPRTVEVIGYEGAWSKIRFTYWGYTYEGFVYTHYLGGVKTYTLDQNYANTLRAKGFPESYVEKLCRLHAVHPNWNFEVLGGLDSLDTAVREERRPINKSLISTTDTNMLSSEPGAYSNGYYVQFEPGWYAASENAVRYYLDPRNFLDENSIFMFEQLSFNNSITEQVIQNMLNGTFMAGEFIYNNQTYTYARALLEAGRTKNVNPVHLAARIIQEQGTGGSRTAHMDGGDGQIYYNYFNFGASGSTAEAIYNGALNYAKASGWNNPYPAIMGAAEDLSDGYISGGQDTVYLQKFNVNGTIARYGYQYMANIQAPYSESYKSYRSYWNSGLIDLSFTFKIPVFADMPAGTIVPTTSSNNNLKSLSVSNASLVPAFDSSITEYKCYIISDTNKVNIQAEVADNKATVTGTGDVTISAGTTNAIVKVKAEDGSEKEYKIAIIKTESSSATPGDVANTVGLRVTDNNLSNFTIGKDVSEYITAIKNNFASSEVKVYDASDKEITKGTVATGQKIKIKNNNQEIIYNVVVYGDTNGDGKVSAQDFAKVKSHLLGATQLSGNSIYAADTNKDGKISAQDFAKIKSHLLGASQLQQ